MKITLCDWCGRDCSGDASMYCIGDVEKPTKHEVCPKCVDRMHKVIEVEIDKIKKEREVE